jgi:hypothetical protein
MREVHEVDLIGVCDRIDPLVRSLHNGDAPDADFLQGVIVAPELGAEHGHLQIDGGSANCSS